MVQLTKERLDPSSLQNRFGSRHQTKVDISTMGTGLACIGWECDQTNLTTEMIGHDFSQGSCPAGWRHQAKRIASKYWRRLPNRGFVLFCSPAESYKGQYGYWIFVCGKLTQTPLGGYVGIMLANKKRTLIGRVLYWDWETPVGASYSRGTCGYRTRM